MESSESPDSKNVTTISDSQASSSGNDQAIAAQHGNIDEQQLGSDAAMNQPCSSRQSLSNQIANVPNDNVNQQHQQLLNNDLHPRPPINEHQQNGPNYQPPVVRPRVPRSMFIIIEQRIPHFHLTFGNRNWLYCNNPKELVSVRVRRQPPMRPGLQPPMEPYQERNVNLCYPKPMNEPLPLPVQQLNGGRNQVPSTPPPLVSRREIEPGIFMELYSHTKPNNSSRNRLTMFGVNRCVCSSYIYHIQNSRNVINVTINNPSLTLQYDMTIGRDGPFYDVFDAYFALTLEKFKITFVVRGRMLCGDDTPSYIGLRDREHIYTFVSSTIGYIFPKKTTDNSK